MKSLLPLLLALAGWLAGCSAQRPDRVNSDVIIGQRLGPITEETDRDRLAELYGADHLTDTTYPIGEGETVPGTIVLRGTSRELTVIWAPDAPGRRVDRVVVSGADWRLPPGLRPGDDMAATEALNGGPFMVYGFGWDYGGVGYFKGGRLDRKVQVWFRPSVEQGADYTSVLGDSLFRSEDASMRAVDPRVARVALVFGGADKP